MANNYNNKDTNKNGVVGGNYYTGKTPEFQSKYKNHQMLDGIQHDPSKMKAVDFKQDYVVMIRKKKYYAISQENDDLYIQVYQINNFFNISTSHNVAGRPGQARITIKGGEKVILADSAKGKANGYKDWDTLKRAWTDQINTYDQLTSQTDKYYWRYAEKADWQPMDEIYIFSKSRYIKGHGSDSAKYRFVQIFFGYISRVTKSWQAGGNGLSISIDADDHLKLLHISRLSNRPPLDMVTGGVGLRYDGMGKLIIEDEPVELTNTYQSAFSGQYPHEIVRACALGAGIPSKYLNKRIEPIMRIPFVSQVDNNVSELYRGESETRLNYLVMAANKLNLEFFADEAGNIVLKIPSYAIGINRMPDNFEGDKLGDDWIANQTPQYKIEKTTIKEKQTKIVTTNGKDTWHTVKRGETLWDISKIYLGKGTYWRVLWNLNKDRIPSKDPNKLTPGLKLLVKKGKATTASRTVEVITGYKETKVKIDPFQLLKAGQGILARNDKFIRVIRPHELLGFTMVDSDEGIYTAATVTAEPALIKAAVSGVPPATTATVTDNELVRQFGYRPAQLAGGNSTPIVSDQNGAMIYANMVLLRSISLRYSSSLTMIEDPAVRVGDPIRFFSYDEHPFSELADRADPAQTVYYVEGIERSIQPNAVSTMTLQLRAGRNLFQPSIYDNVTELYRYYYEETAMNAAEETAPKPAAPAKPKPGSKPVPAKESYKTHVVKKGETLQSLSKKYYGTTSLWTKIWEENRKDKKKGPIGNPNWIYPGQKLKIPPK